MRYLIVSTLITLIAILASVTPAIAQLNEGGEPLSFSLENQLSIQSLNFVDMEPVDVEALRREDRTRDFEPATPYRFGQNLYVSLNPDNSGNITTIKNFKVWQLGIRSAGAVSINLLFDDYELPEGAKLYIYSADRSEVLGAFTDRNNQADRQFATGLIFSDAIVIEYLEPDDAAFEGRINLSRVTHGYRGVGDYSLQGFGDAGSCNLNVACPETQGWEDQIRSTVMLVTGGSGFCTGTVLNNTAMDGTPYVLSANHCHRDAGSVVFWFNWQSETCDNPSTSPDRDIMSGAVTRARNTASDFWLMEINDEIPFDYEVYHSGWNTTLADEIEGYIVGIHHPRADIKKFSYTNDGVTASSYLGAPGSGTTHWRVGFWEDGTTTEPGSSGSSLYDSNQRLIGQLHGGYAACGNELEDWYGRFGVSWTGNGSPNTRLSDWLDPGNTGVEYIDGFDPNTGAFDVDAQLAAISSPRGSYDLGDVITPQVTLRNAGAEDLESALVYYTINDGEPVTYQWSGLLEMGETAPITFPDIVPAAGDYEFFAAVEIPGDENPMNDSRTSGFRVVDCTSAGNLPFFEPFDYSPDCWEITDNLGNGQVWRYGTNNRGSNSLPGEFGSYMYLDSDAYGSGNSQDSDLITPKFDFTNYEGITISFDHFFRQYQTSVASVHYSTDNGSTWTQLADWTEDTSNPAHYSTVIPELDGEGEVRFKWSYTGSWDWYWSVDNVSVSGEQVVFEPSAVQFVHNSADPGLESLDVYLNGVLFRSNFEFLSATEPLMIPYGESRLIELTKPNSHRVILSRTEEFINGDSYMFLIQGVQDEDGFADNPDGKVIESRIELVKGKHHHYDGDDVRLYVYHSTTDQSGISISLEDETVLAENLSYGEMSDTGVSFAPDSYLLEVRESTTNTFIGAFEADLSALSGQVVGIYTTGFAKPADNYNGRPFGLVALHEDGTVVELQQATSAATDIADIPSDFGLGQNYPNPFNPTTTIQYSLPEQAEVRLNVYNLMGQRVATLVNDTQSAGHHSISFDASSLSSGVYIYRIQAGSFTQTRKMLMIK